MLCVRNSKYRRVSSCIVYSLLLFIIGYDGNIRATQLVYYLEEIKAKNASFYQGLLPVVAEIVGACFALIFGHLCDKYGKARYWVSFGNAFGFVGTAIYSIPFSPITMLVGQAFHGVFMSLAAVGTVEMARMFDGQSFTKVLSIVTLGKTVGSITGPMINLLLVHVDINLNYGWIYIRPTNVPGFTVCGMILMLQVFLIFALYNSEDIAIDNNIIEQYPLLNSSELEEPHAGSGGLISLSTGYLTGSYSNAAPVILLLSNDRLLLLYVATFLWTYILYSYESILSVVSAEWLGYNSTTLSWALIIACSLSVSANLIIAALKKRKPIDFQLVISMSIIQLTIPIFILLLYITQKDEHLAVILYYTWVILTTVTWLLENVLGRSMVSQLSPVEVQGLSEGVRSAARGFALILSGVTVGLWLQYVILFSVVVLLLQLLLLSSLLMKRDFFIHPTRMKLSEVIQVD